MRFHDRRSARCDDVLVATQDLAAAVARGRDLAEYHQALRAFRYAVRWRFYAEVALGLPPDVVRHVMSCAIRMALESPACEAGAEAVFYIALATLGAAQRGLADDVSA